MRPLQQIGTVTAISFRSLHTRIKNSLTIVVGIGSMVFVLLSILSIAEGIRLIFLESGDPGRALIYATNVFFYDRGRLPSGMASIANDAPGIARGPDGAKLVDAEIILSVDGLIKRNNNDTGFTTILGVGPHWKAMTPSLRLISGRMPQPGAKELIAGDLAQRKFSSIDDGFVKFKSAQWRIVGIFVTDSWQDGYLVGDAPTLKAAANQSSDTIVVARLTAPDKFEAFRRALQKRLPQNIGVERETDQYVADWKRVTDSGALVIAYTLAGLIGSGMVAGTMLTMRFAVEDRAREIAILRAIGFRSFAVAASVVLEATLLATLGSVIGTALVWLWLDNFLYNGAGNVFAVRVNLHMLVVGLSWAFIVALIGALIPAIQAERQTVIESLKEF